MVDFLSCILVTWQPNTFIFFRNVFLLFIKWLQLPILQVSDCHDIAVEFIDNVRSCVGFRVYLREIWTELSDNFRIDFHSDSESFLFACGIRCCDVLEIIRKTTHFTQLFRWFFTKWHNLNVRVFLADSAFKLMAGYNVGKTWTAVHNIESKCL